MRNKIDLEKKLKMQKSECIQDRKTSDPNRSRQN